MSWANEIKCKKCNSEMIHENNEKLKCKLCNAVIKLVNQEITHAFCETGKGIYYRYVNDNEYEMRYFENIVLEELEGAYQAASILNKNELSPIKLLKIVCDQHDALKKHLQRVLSNKNSALCSSEKQAIESDQGSKFNIKKLLNKLSAAYPVKYTHIESIIDANKDTIGMILWVRNKHNHYAPSKWNKLPVHIYIDPALEPDSTFPPNDILNYNFIKKTNNAVIDIYTSMFNLEQNTIEDWRKDAIERYRI
ncbi:MAG: hypothetical protein HZC28_08745 [Spirochaetes bacterium]|nr:hypothetical protein [Spirochaetota bacterium]